MGTVAARRAGDALTDVSRILAIQAMCVAQAMELRRREDDRAFSVTADALHATVRHHSAFLEEDRPLSTDIETIATGLLAGAVTRRMGRRSSELREALEAF